MLPESTSPVMTSPPGPVTVIDGRSYVYFAGTSYLGLAGHPEVIQAACEAVRQLGVHTATSRSGFGNNPLTLEVERRAAEFFGTERAFYFSSGYVANHIVLQALADRVDATFVDEASHYCLLEAARLLGKPVTAFRHRDPDDLARCLRENLPAGGRPLVLTDGVFSVSGRLAPVKEYLRVLEPYAPAALHLDDAHGLGVLGENGRGVLEHFGLWGPRVNSAVEADGVSLTICGTLAKAIGGFGGVVPGTREFVSRVRASSHYFDGASAPSSADAGATAKAIELVQRQPELRRQLQANIARLRTGLRTLGLAVEDGPAANFSVEIGNGANMRRLHAELRAAGFLVPYVAKYSGLGPEGALRFAVCARHTAEMIDGVIAALRKAL
ncbi:MAG: pyridoxal phosphate-dependent aminotransferase family protein [Verrucomicrobia bacterium]|nr:pyridoxal phosphate-dependent aminotransferase family protein [Verrucomicrobiota bacterium]